MRMRKKKHCQERMDKCGELLIADPAQNKGKWRDIFGNDNPVHIEIGCGKGRFITEMSKINPDINFIAVEKVEDVLVMAMEKAKDAGLSNIKFMSIDAGGIEDIFDMGEIERIYLNFSDPWRKSKHAKRRLTHKRFLDRYKNILKKGGMICFKTDNRDLFEFSLNSFCAEDEFRLQNITLDLHKIPNDWNIMTEYEQKFTEEGMPIYRLEAVYR